MTDQPKTPAPLTPEVEERADKAGEHAQALAKAPRTIRELLAGPEFAKAVAEVAPSVLRPSRFIRTVLNAIMRNPDLEQCTRDSFFRCLLESCFLGIEPDNRRAYLIPYRNRKLGIVECQLRIDYKGLAELVRRSGDVSFIHADVVRAGDFFEYSYGTNAHLVHRPAEGERGDLRCAYSYVRLKDQSEDFVVMNPSEIEKVRRRSQTPNEGPWTTDFDEMAKKTVFRRHSKWLPLTPETRMAIDTSDPDAIEVTNTWDKAIAGPADEEEAATARPTLKELARQRTERLSAATKETKSE